MNVEAASTAVREFLTLKLGTEEYGIELDAPKAKTGGSAKASADAEWQEFQPRIGRTGPVAGPDGPTVAASGRVTGSAGRLAPGLHALRKVMAWRHDRK